LSVITRWTLTPRPANQASARSRNGTALSLRSSDSTLAVRQPRGVIDTDVDVFPAGTAPVVAAIAGDPVSDRLDPAELLDVDRDQLTRPLALVAHCRRLGFERAEPAEPEATQNFARGRHRHGELTRDGRAAQALMPQPLDLGDPLGRGAVPVELTRFGGRFVT
jgi:hypothetical protein